MEEYSFSVVVEAVEEGGYVAHVPALPGCHTQGETFDETIAHVREALQGHIQMLVRNGWTIPVERKSASSSALRLSVSAPVAA